MTCRISVSSARLYKNIIDIYIDKYLTLHAKIIDTYDFNKNDKNDLVQSAERLQSKGEIETFFTVTNIEMPKSQWQKYIDGSKWKKFFEENSGKH